MMANNSFENYGMVNIMICLIPVELLSNEFSTWTS